MLYKQLVAVIAAQYSLIATARPAPLPVPAPVPLALSSICLAGAQTPALFTRTLDSHAPTQVQARANAVAPAEYTADPTLGGGGNQPSVDSAHFRIYNADSTSAAKSLKHLEAAHACFVEKLGWRTPGLSINSGGVGEEVGPWYKLNVYSVNTLSGNAAGVQSADMSVGRAYLQVVDTYLAEPEVVVHEFGHAMHMSEKLWVGQGNTGAWWEPVANFIADTYTATPTCNEEREAAGLSGTEGDSTIALQKVIGDSFQVLVDGTVDSGNYYESWPFLAYITNNPDKTPSLGSTVLLDMIRKYSPDSNETPLHTLSRLLSTGSTNSTTIQQVVGRYWARMAYVDIGHARAHAAFLATPDLPYNNLQASSQNTYKVVSARAPRYMGANINPLTVTGSTVSVSISAQAPYTATLVVSPAAGGNITYTDVVNGKASVPVQKGDGVSLVVANTPELITYDPFEIPDEVNKGLEYSVVIEGATA